MRPHLARIKDYTKGIIQYLCKGTQISEAKPRLAVGCRTFHPLMQFLKNDVFDDFIGCLIV